MAKRFAVLPGGRDEYIKKEKRIIRFVQLLMVIFCFQLTWTFFSGYIYSFLLKTQIVKETNIDYFFEAKGLLGFDETVVVSPVSGTLRWSALEGKRVAVGEEVVGIRGAEYNNNQLAAPIAGVLSYYTDGLEGFVYPREGWQPDKDVFYSYTPLPRSLTQGDRVERGTPLFKIVNNFNWYMAVFLTDEEFSKVKDSDRIFINFAFYPQEIVRSDRYKLIYKDSDDNHLVVFSFSNDVSDFFRRRWEECRVIYRRDKGVLVPESAIITKEDSTGVYRISRSRVVFTEVTIHDKDREDQMLLVEGLGQGWEIIANPRFFRDGQRLN